MIRYLKHTEVDKKKWDECLAGSPQSIIYAQSWFLDIVCPGWEALVEDDYNYIFPLTKRVKAGISYLFQPPFTQQLGIFSKDGHVSDKKLKEFISAIPGKFKLIEIQLNVENMISDLPAFRLNRKITHHLNLSYSPDELRKKYSENLLRNIKKATNIGINVSKKISPEKVIDLFRANRGSTITNLKKADYASLQKLVYETDQRKCLDCRGVINSDNDLIAGAFFLKSFRSYIFLFSATNEEAREKGAMSMLIDSFIADHSGEDKILDFEGSMDTNLARFYKSFGSKEVVYLQIQKNNLPVIIRWLK